MPHKPGFIHTGKDENSWNYFELPFFGSGAEYKKPIALEDLPYTPAVLGEMLENKEKERELEIEGLGKGKLVISKQNKNKPFFYPDQSEEYTAKKSRQLQIGEVVGNLPLITSPLTMPFAMRTVPPRAGIYDRYTGTRVEGPLPGSKGGKTLLQQRRDNNYIRKLDKETKKIEWLKKNKPEIFKDKKGPINVTESAVEEAFNLNPDIFRRASKIYKANPSIGMKKAIEEAKLLEGFMPSQLISDKTFGSLKKNSLFSPNYKPPNLMFTSSMGDITGGDVGIPGIKKTKVSKNITTPEFINKRFSDYGFTQKGPNGGWIMDEKRYNGVDSEGKPFLNDNQKREIIQIFQTDINQTVPLSFTKEKNIKNLAFNEKYAAYNTKYGARAELHHDFPSALSAKFYFGLEYMSDEHLQMIAIANEYGNYPGQPMTEGGSNLVSLPSKIGVNHPNYFLVKERFGNVPPHLHNIIHSQFFANETGMTGDKFFTPRRENLINKSFEDRVEVFREWNKIVKRNRELWTEGLKQLDIFFGSVPKEYHDDLVRMLEEYVEKGMITIGKGRVRDRFGELVKDGDGNLAEANYAQFSVQDIVSNALADFKADFRNDILGKNPRFKEALTEVSNFSQLNQSEIDDMALVLYKIKQYNGLRMVVGTRRAGEMVFGAGQNVRYYNELIELYMGLIDDALPNDEPTITTLEQLKQTTFKDFKKPSFIEQLEIEFPDDG